MAVRRMDNVLIGVDDVIARLRTHGAELGGRAGWRRSAAECDRAER
ncbi:hypothetical protein ABZ307_15095 [Streptomyces griseorubiginosus]